MAASEIEFAGSLGNKPDLTKDGVDMEEFTLIKRLPRKFPKRKNDIYVSRKTDIKAQMARCQQLLEAGHTEVYIHGLGAAINRAMTLALRLKDGGLGTLDISANTSTVELIDDLMPKGDSADADVQTRNNSAIHIKLFRTDNPPTLPESTVAEDDKSKSSKSKKGGGKGFKFKEAAPKGGRSKKGKTTTKRKAEQSSQGVTQHTE